MSSITCESAARTGWLFLKAYRSQKGKGGKQNHGPPVSQKKQPQGQEGPASRTDQIGKIYTADRIRLSAERRGYDKTCKQKGKSEKDVVEAYQPDAACFPSQCIEIKRDPVGQPECRKYGEGVAQASSR